MFCAKHVPEWSKAWLGVVNAQRPEQLATPRDDMVGLLLAVYEVDSMTVTTKAKPWRIGTLYGTKGARKEESHSWAGNP